MLDINTDPIPEPQESWSVEKLYTEAKKAMDQGETETALKY